MLKTSLETNPGKDCSFDCSANAFIDRKEVRVTGLEGMSREELENKLKELSEKIDGHNAKTIEVESEDTALIKKG